MTQNPHLYFHCMCVVTRLPLLSLNDTVDKYCRYGPAQVIQAYDVIKSPRLVWSGLTGGGLNH